jgi:hypothetical protein
VPALQAEPLRRAAVQTPATQYGAGERQSPSLRQDVRQALAPSLQARLPPHVCGAAAWQAPAPSQDAAGVRVAPVQLCARQTVDSPGNVQVLRDDDAHEPAQAPLPAQAARAPCGAPEITGEQ